MSQQVYESGHLFFAEYIIIIKCLNKKIRKKTYKIFETGVRDGYAG